jgi:SNF2 family DNA or RNA helicase
MPFSLYEFQTQDVEKIERQKAGAIGSEMGTGKTHEAIALDEAWWKKGAPPTLIVAPLNTHESWVEKYSMQCPSTDVTVINRKNRDTFVNDIRRKRGDVFIMHWDALRLMPELAGFQFNTIVADEVHRAANRKAQQTLALKKLHTNYKLAMSGTMSGDMPQNLWSTFNWLYPSYYTSFWSFFKHYVVQEHVPDPADPLNPQKGYRKVVGVQNIDSLKREIDPWFVRHLKKEECCDFHPKGVMPWLPDKTYDVMWVDLTPTQRKFYEQMRKNMVAWVNEHEDSPLVANIAIVQMMRLSQMSLATPFIDGTKMVWRNQMIDGIKQKVQVEVDNVKLILPSAKIDVVAEKIQDAGDKQFGVMTSSKPVAYLAAQEFERKGITANVLSGDTKESDRTTMVSRFVDKKYQVFVGVIQAAGEGIDGLQHATDTCFFLDRTWSSRMNGQAEDRYHRGGTKNTVQIIDVMARGTLDWGRRQRLETKWSWMKQILGDPAAAQAQEMEHYKEEF